jgi:hypothetical protein
MVYFNDFFGNLFVFALLLYVSFVLIDGIGGFRDFLTYRTFLGEPRSRTRGKWL